MVETSISEKSDSSLINAVLAPNKWDATTLNYGFQIQDIDQNGIADFNEGQWRGFYKSIFDNISSFTNLTFRETSFEESTLGQILTVGGGGSSFDPHPGMPNGNTHTSVGIQGTVAEASDVVFRGQWSEVWYHEIGHSLGLDHPFERPGAIAGVRSEADLGTNFLNSSLYTVMSYSPFAWGEDNPWTTAKDAGKTFMNASVGSYMPIDIAALQHLYGARAANTGDTVYTFGDDLRTNAGFNTIWDTGGNDTIRYVGSSRAKIDLRAATLKDEIGGGGFVSTSDKLNGGFLIANGVAIETAIGGSKDDILHGHDGDNTLIGGAGNDTLFGYAGNDVLEGGTGSDRLDGGEGIDAARFAGQSRDYAIVYDASTTASAFAVKHIATGALDTLASIETLVFDDTALESQGVFTHLEARFGALASGSQKFELALSPEADDPIATDVADIDGAFTASATVLFADLAGGSWQRVFDFGNGPASDNIFLGQVGRSSDMEFTVFNGGKAASIVATGAIVEGQEAEWTADVDAGGWMRLFKDGALLAQGSGRRAAGHRAGQRVRRQVQLVLGHAADRHGERSDGNGAQRHPGDRRRFHDVRRGTLRQPRRRTLPAAVRHRQRPGQRQHLGRPGRERRRHGVRDPHRLGQAPDHRSRRDRPGRDRGLAGQRDGWRLYAPVQERPPRRRGAGRRPARRDPRGRPDRPVQLDLGHAADR